MYQTESVKVWTIKLKNQSPKKGWRAKLAVGVIHASSKEGGDWASLNSPPPGGKRSQDLTPRPDT
jgi:hypothetical protein